jgi:hypothetical protein
MNREKLTAKQEKVFRFLASDFAKHQRMPTIREVSEHMGFASIPAGANSHLVAKVPQPLDECLSEVVFGFPLRVYGTFAC